MLANKSIEELNALASCFEGHQIRSAEERLFEKIETKLMNESWKQRLSINKWWATDYQGKIEEACKPLLPLRDFLLSFGGEEVCLPYTEEDLAKINERGQLWLGDPHIMMKGAPSQCHTNTSLLWDNNKDNVLIATGYALSKDGMWRQHSWCVMVDEEDGATIVETTEPRAAYFGFVMNKEESIEFYENNT